jgi:hypothetical protein
MKVKIELSNNTIGKLREYKDDYDRDLYYSFDYDLRDNYKPSTFDDIINQLLKTDKIYWELINDKNKDLKVELRNDG